MNAHGLSWVGNTGSGPVSYSFTITSFPKAPAYTTEAYMFLIPNPAAREGAPDYNETNAAWLEIQSTPTGGQGIFQYKVNEGSGNNMFYGNGSYTNAPGSFPGGTNVLSSNGTNVWTESGNLTNVQSTLLLGTWTLKFTSDQNGMIIAPDGTTASFTIPSYYYTNFTETSGFNIYLGMQGNTGAAQNQGVVYSNFSVQGVAIPTQRDLHGSDFFEFGVDQCLRRPPCRCPDRTSNRTLLDRLDNSRHRVLFDRQRQSERQCAVEKCFHLRSHPDGWHQHAVDFRN